MYDVQRFSSDILLLISLHLDTRIRLRNVNRMIVKLLSILYQYIQTLVSWIQRYEAQRACSTWSSLGPPLLWLLEWFFTQARYWIQMSQRFTYPIVCMYHPQMSWNTAVHPGTTRSVA